MAYRFHVHARRPSWRLVTRDDLAFPAEAMPQDWTFTRAREEADVNADVRGEIAQRGYCLFKIGATFADLAAENAASNIS
jgi:hypothetical protein